MRIKLTKSVVLETLTDCSNMFLSFDELYYITFRLIPEYGTLTENALRQWLLENTAIKHSWEIDGAMVAVLATGFLAYYNTEGSNKFHLTTKGRRARHAISS